MEKNILSLSLGNLNGTQLFPVTSNQTTLITVPPIIINVLETNKTAILNQTENLPTFSVDATTNNSNENLVYQWYMTETGSVNDGILIEGSASSLYNIPASDLSKIGTKYYYVKVSGTVNSVAILPKNSAIMTLNIINP